MSNGYLDARRRRRGRGRGVGARSCWRDGRRPAADLRCAPVATACRLASTSGFARSQVAMERLASATRRCPPAGRARGRRAFWRLMASNDFESGAECSPTTLSANGRSQPNASAEANLARMNAEYRRTGRGGVPPGAAGLQRARVVTQVAITDGPQHATAISFFEVADGRIARLSEYRPSCIRRANWRHLVEPIA